MDTGGRAKKAQRVSEWTTSIHRPGYQCHTCADEVRISRGCDRPLRDFAAYPEPRQPPTCPILEIRPWFWSLVDRTRRHRAGLLPFDPVTEPYPAMMLIETLEAAQELQEARNASAQAQGYRSQEDQQTREHNRAILAKRIKRGQ